MNGFEALFGSAKWLEATEEGAFPVIRQSFSLDAIPSDATLNIIGFGGFTVYLNGRIVTDNLFLPLNTDFEKRETPIGEETAHRILCESYPVSHLLCEGKNTLVVLLGEGWYTGVAREKPFGGKKVCFHLYDKESGADLACSDLRAVWAPSFVTEGKFNRGETQDFHGWDDRMTAQVFDDSAWARVREARAPESEYMLSDCPRDRVIETIKPLLLSKDERGALYDAGTNLTGYPVLRAKDGQVSVRFSELLSPDGDLEEFHGHGQYLDYTLNGTEQLLYPRFAWIGFRYFYVTGEAEVLSVQRIHADIEVNSDFVSDNETLNWLYRAYVNTQLCNMHNGIPSDCPHIERRGYTGDGQLVCRAAMRTLDARRFYRKWSDDIADCQDRLSGRVPHTAPYTRSGGGPGGWGCAIVVLPYEYWKMYGDDRPMREMFDGMLEYFRYMEDHSSRCLVTSDKEGEWCLGEWCPPRAVILPPPFINNYYYVKSMYMAVEIARHIGREDVIPLLEARIEERKQAIIDAYFNQLDGNFLGNVQGANAFALDIGLGDERTVKHFLEHYETESYYDTGIFGTDIVTRMLFKAGRANLAVRLLSAAEPHGFGLWQREGSTTLWEYWDYDRTIRSRSLSHPMFGAVVAYFFEYLLGIANREGGAGYDYIDIKPCLVDGLSRVSGHMTTKNGRVGVSYVRTVRELHLTLEIPQSTEARLILPNDETHDVGAGMYTFIAEMEGDRIIQILKKERVQ